MPAAHMGQVLGALQALFVILQTLPHLDQFEVRDRQVIDAGTEIQKVALCVTSDPASNGTENQQDQVHVEYRLVRCSGISQHPKL